jgi:proline iminopeptidase
MRQLYPQIQPNQHFQLPVDDIHTLYVEECGSEAGIPVVFLHGGPGSGCEPFHRQYFDPEKYRIILFDQRGCGRSTPHAELQNNTTQDLIADIETIRAHFNIEKWLVFGGSWGSTLGLVYAETYPERVSGLIMRGIFLSRPKDIAWFYQEGASKVYPDYWQDYLSPIPSNQHHDLLNAYHQLLTGEDEVARMRAAKAWSGWEGMAANLTPKHAVLNHFTDLHTAISVARIEAHYFVNNSFLEENQIIKHADRLANIPGIIIHGRYDMICPLEQAHALAKAWPTAEFDIIPACGHAGSEEAIIDALIKATDNMADILK